MRLFQVEYASLRMNNSCKLCCYIGIPFDEYKDRVWTYCPECGRCVCKYFFPFDEERPEKKNLQKVPDDYVEPQRVIVHKSKSKESNDVNTLLSLLRNNLTND